MAENKSSHWLRPHTGLRRGAFQLWLRRLIAGVALLLAVRPGAVFGIEIDRLLAAVNGRVVTESDLELIRGLSSIVSPERREMATSDKDEISRLIDVELMRQELATFGDSQNDEGRMRARMEAFRTAWAGKGGLAPLLSRLGLQEHELDSYLKLESSILRFVDFRFRPFVTVSDREIQAYYETRLTPQLREAGADLPQLTEVWGKIEELLREEKINVVLDQWIKEIRRNSRIERFGELGGE